MNQASMLYTFPHAMLNFFTKALIKRQLKDVPPAELDKVFSLIEKNPELFQKVAVSLQEKMKAGMSHEDAAKSLMAESGEDVKKIMEIFGGK